ncbi:MAG: guanylate kinase [Bacteroidetes bacterium QS_8_68_28]|nr:MAG: guanylate kinase [Bacteroidetes bacterium QS_8_68_28]
MPDGPSAPAPASPPPEQRPDAPPIIVLTAPSGAGKTTIARRVLREMPEMRFSVSATTRAPRPGEEDGTHYHFISEEDFRRCITEGALVEYEEVYPDQFYGTLHSELERGDAPVLLDIDVKGATSVKEAFGERALVLFIRPPSLEALARRLEGRGTEAEEDLDKRLERAEMELARADACDAVVVNDDLTEAVEETLRHVRSFAES